MRPSLVSRVRCSLAGAAPWSWAEFVAFGGCWPVGHVEYRTEVSDQPRLRKMVYGWLRALRLDAAGFLQSLTEILPLLDQRSMSGFVLVEFLRLALVFVRADEVLQRGLALCDCRFGGADFGFQFMDAIFHLLALDGIQTFCL